MELASILSLGYRLQYLKRAQTLRPSVKGEGYLLENAKLIEGFAEELNINGPIKTQIKQIINKLDKYEEKDEEGNNIKVTDADAQFLQDKATTLYELISSELQDILNFQVIEECCLDKSNLIKLMNKEKCVFFDEEIWNRFTEIGKSDFSDAAKCLLIGAATPATMITMRATEEILKDYYLHKTGQDPGKKAWGTLTGELRKMQGIDSILIGHLDYLRTARRNIAQHPNRTFTQREAERIFMEIIPTVYSIFLDMA